MISFPVGLFSIILVFYLSVGSGSWATYWQIHSLIIVIGGTFALLFFTTPTSIIKSLSRSILHLFKKEDNYNEFNKELFELTKSKSLKKKSNHPLIHYATELWEQGVDNKLFCVLIAQKKNELESEPIEGIQSLKNLAKYPPSLGMAGTVMGMISLFSNLDSNKENIGSHLAIAMTATFLGIVLTNMVISPLADRLHIKQLKYQKSNNNIYNILLLIHRKEPLVLIEGELGEKSA